MASKREVSIIIKAIDRASRVLKSVTNTTSSSLQRLATQGQAAAKSIAAVGAAMALVLGLAINTTADFQQSMANTQSVIGATTAELEQLTNAAREMGKVSVFSASQAADAMFFLASAGLNTEKVIAALGGTMDLAAATMSELSFTTETVVSTLAAFGLQAKESDRVANVFAATISGSQATMERLATAMSFVAPVANAVNLSLEETSALLGRLFTSGIAASTAGTALRQAFAQLLKPTDATQAALDRLGIVVQTSDGNIRNFIDIIREFEQTGLTAADAMTIFGVRAGPALLTLVNQGADAIDELTKKVTGTNKAAEMAALQINTFRGQTKLLRSAIQELQIEIGTVLLPTLTEYQRTITDIVNQTTTWAKAHPILIKVITETTSVMAVLLTAMGGGLLLLGSFTRAIQALTVAFGAAGTGFIAIIGLAIIAMTAFILKAKAAEGQARRTRNAISGRFTAEDVISGVPEAVAEFDRLRSEIATMTDKIIILEQEIAKRKARILEQPALAGTSFELRLIQMQESIEVFRARFASTVSEIAKISIRPELFRALLPSFPDVPEAGDTTDRPTKEAKELLALREQLRKDLAQLTKSQADFEIGELLRTAEAQRTLAQTAINGAELVAQINEVTSRKIIALREGEKKANIEVIDAQREAAKAASEEQIAAAQRAVNAALAFQQQRARQLENFHIKDLELQGKAEEAFLARLGQEAQARRAAGQTAIEIADFVMNTILMRRQEVSDKEKAIREARLIELANLEQDLVNTQLSAEQALVENLNSIRQSAFQMEQNRIRQMTQSYAGFIRSAINIGRQFFSEQEAGWIRALAALVRFITRAIAGFLRQRALEKLKRAEEAKTSANFLIQHAAKMTALAAEHAAASLVAFATGDIARGLALGKAAAIEGAAALKSVGEAAIFEGQAIALQTEAAGLMTAATAVEVAGAAVAGGIDLAADAAQRAARNEKELARDTERRLQTELDLKLRILELEGRTAEARRLSLEAETNRLAELGVDPNLINRFEQLSLRGTGQPTGGGGGDFGLSPIPAGATLGTSGGTVVHQTNTFIGIIDLSNQDQLRELAIAMRPFNEEIEDLETEA